MMETSFGTTLKKKIREVEPLVEVPSPADVSVDTVSGECSSLSCSRQLGTRQFSSLICAAKTGARVLETGWAPGERGRNTWRRF